MRRAAAAGLALCLLAAPAGAEGPTAPTAEMRALARELAETMGMESQLKQSMEMMRGVVAQMMQVGAPNKSPAEIAHIVDGVLLPEIQSRIGEMRDVLVEIYAENYSLEDMKELRAFYETPLGQRVLKAAPVIGAQSFAAGRKWGEVVAGDAIRKNAEELRRRGVTL